MAEQTKENNDKTKRKSRGDSRTRLVLMCIKYALAVIFAILPMRVMHDASYTIAGLVELLLIVVITNILAIKSTRAAKIFNTVFIILLEVQMAVLLFGSTYIETVMLSNLDSLEDISGNAAAYLTAAAIVIAQAFLPVCAFGRRMFDRWFKAAGIVLILAVVEIAILLGFGVSCSPFASYVILLQQEYQTWQMNRKVSSAEGELVVNMFYSDGVTDYREKDEALSDQPNVIVIFTEGLSQSVIDDEREIMPNMAALQEKSLNFTGYYNHTFATYRALIGQLYSGYQLNNLDENSLVSLQSIMSKEGYHTAFINTEPNNEGFTEYLDAMGFDELISEDSDELSGANGSYSDREAYELLLDTAESLYQADEPYFLAIYTFGTHASLDSGDEVFGDGSDSELNKFYNADAQFGVFLEEFEKSEIAENTIIVLTADHATYQDSGFVTAFPDYERANTQVDEMPLMIYYVGIEPETIDVGGRNTLDFAPTILDYLDISAPNYFLGKSLFAEASNGESYDTIFYSETSPISTKDGNISMLSEDDKKWFEEMVQQYFIAKLSDVTEEEQNEIDAVTERTETVLSEDALTLDVTYSPSEGEEYTNCWLAVWSAENGQDDMVWYRAQWEETDAVWYAALPLSDHTLHGELSVHIYGGEGSPTDLLDTVTVALP